MSIKDTNFGISSLRDITVKIPLNMEADSIGFETLNENQIAEVINYNLKSILLTIPGELMDTNFGVGLKSYLFEQSVDVFGIKNAIDNQISLYMPWLSQVNTRVLINEENYLSIRIKYKLNQPEVIDYFDLSLSLDEL